MKIGIITVRKRWNNAPYFLIEGIKQGIRDLLCENYHFNNNEFIFIRFTHHTPSKLYIDPESVKNLDIIIIPFWIGNQILQCNLKELKEKTNIKICTYSGHAIYNKIPPFEFDFKFKEFKQGKLTNKEWENFNAIDYFFVVKKLYPFKNEIEIGCGKFDWLLPNKSKYNGIVIDFCKKNWDEFVWNEFREVFPIIQEKYNVELIQLGTYPFVIKGAKVFDKKFVHYRRLCKLFSKIKIFICMNESFGYSLLDNKYAGNLILLNEKAEIPNFHLNSNHIKLWNKNDIVYKIGDYLNNKDVSKEISNNFVKENPSLCSWKNVVLRIIDELSKI